MVCFSWFVWSLDPGSADAAAIALSKIRGHLVLVWEDERDTRGRTLCHGPGHAPLLVWVCDRGAGSPAATRALYDRTTCSPGVMDGPSTAETIPPATHPVPCPCHRCGGLKPTLDA